MKKVMVLLLCCALVFIPVLPVAAGETGAHYGIKPASACRKEDLSSLHPMKSPATGPLNPAALKLPTHGLMQFRAGSHIMGFKPDRVYFVDTSGFIAVGFMGTKGVTPIATAGRKQKGGILAKLGKVEYKNLWQGITLSYEENSQGIAESTYRVMPGADVGNIRLRYSGKTGLQPDGSLRVELPAGQGLMTESRPVAWQDIRGKRVPVEVSFVLLGDEVGFRTGRYDPDFPLIIDPTYQWHTFYGPSADETLANGIAVDGSGNVYVTGESSATWNGPAPGSKAPLNAYSGGWDIFVLKLDSAGAYQWHTFYGSTSDDEARGIAVDGSGNVYATGYSSAAWDGPGSSPVSPLHAYTGGEDTFVLKLNSSGAYQWHTFYGSTAEDEGWGIAVGGSNVYVTGYSYATWDAGTQGPLNDFSPSGGSTLTDDIFVLKLSSGGAYQWHTFYGSVSYDQGHGIAVDGSGNVYVAGDSWATWNGPKGQGPLRAFRGGSDVFVLKLDSTGTYQWHTFYGSSADDEGWGIAVDGSGNVFVTGDSLATWDGPHRATPLHAYSGSSDIFVLKLNSGGAYQWHTFYGSSDNDRGWGIAVDGSGNVYVEGTSWATWDGPGGDLPLNAFTPSSGGTPLADIFVLKLNSGGTYQWHTFYGSSGGDAGQGIAADGNGNIYLTGYSTATWNGPGSTSPLNSYSGGSDDVVVLKMGPSTHFLVSAPPSVTVGTPFNYTVTAVDQNGNTMTTYAGTVHFISSDGSAVLPANSTLTNGTGTFSATMNTDGYETITATDTVSPSITGTGGTVVSGSASATHFSVSAPASVAAGTPFNYKVKALDQYGNTVTGYSGTVHFTSSDGSAVLPANSTLTNGTGTFSATLKTEGNQTITATDTVTSSITGTSGTIVVSSAAATKFLVSAPGSATAGTPFSYTVTAVDQYGNTVTGYSGTVHFTSSDGSAVLPANSTLTSGTGTFSATLKTEGNQTITATDTVSPSITGTSATIVVSSASATHFTVSTPPSVTAGTPFNYTVTAVDQYGNTVTGYSGTVDFTSSDGSSVLPSDSTLISGTGTFSATMKTDGHETITATDTVSSSITGTAGTVVVSTAVPLDVPALNDWGMIVFIMFSLMGSILSIRRRSRIDR